MTKGLKITPDPRLLVGIETRDDAGVFRLREDLALVHTVDYITPISNDPYEFGRVAAANSLSDVYAMGGDPVTVLNVCAFPEKGIDPGDLTQILQGGLDATTEAGAVLAGGHTVCDSDLKYGLAVTGTIHPDKIWRNSGARPGDRLILTKPIGTGATLTAYRKGKLDPERFRSVYEQMATLNKTACETARGFRIHGATDITGYGLAGHALGMAQGAGVEVVFRFEAIPRFPWAVDLIRKGMGTRATRPNEEHAGPHTNLPETLTREERDLVFEPQTSGGLLLSVHPEDADALLDALHEKGVAEAALVGEVSPTEGAGTVTIR